MGPLGGGAAWDVSVSAPPTDVDLLAAGIGQAGTSTTTPGISSTSTKTPGRAPVAGGRPRTAEPVKWLTFAKYRPWYDPQSKRIAGQLCGLYHEIFFNVMLPKLRAQKPKKQCPPGLQAVRTAGNITLPDYVQRVLSLGPKFAVEPRKTAPELLSMARCIGRAAPDSEGVRCVSECVDVLCRRKPVANQQPVQQAQQFLRDSSLSVLPADKKGGFVVLTEGYLTAAICDGRDLTNAKLANVHKQTGRCQPKCDSFFWPAAVL
ncbi:hypothetical protein HPB52_007843 [Rhipicephalus sanguineus]|uniref:Uncharacterized protein n=1 Tax=Rhipicephalus sanguineus TaxID=34632 RepID=A0A9D4QA75_RHISA|nr:hypothetical protein HPB52_007843 [Rhipicephalus sanguineus]